MRKFLFIVAFVMACAASASAQAPAQSPSVTAGPSESAEPAAPRVARERVVLRTNMGDLVLAFYPEVAPEHTAQILNLVRAGLYDGLEFHRVEGSFVAQLSDARYRKPEPSAEQLALIRRLPVEIGDLKHERGTLSMARYEDRPDSAETSFSILFDAAPHLDGKYTIFGRLESGYDVLDAIGRVRRDAQHRPLRPVVVRRAEVAESPEALAAMRLRGPDYTEQYPPLYLTLSRLSWAFGAMVAVGLALFVISGREAFAPWVGSAGLLSVLVGFFGLLVAFVPTARTTGWVSILLFAGVVALFKLMNRFESGKRQSPKLKSEAQRAES
jgi:cyclophilin family peptidyl-prolyl cis-trans isomerase